MMRHRKVAQLASEMRIKRSQALGHLHALWHAAIEQQEDGDLSNWSDEFIAESSDVSTDAPQFVRLLQKLGWLDDKRIHDWIDYAGMYLRMKYAKRCRDRLVTIWAKHGRTYGAEDANGNPTDSVGNPTDSIVDNTTQHRHNTNQKKESAVADGFSRFWSSWPKHHRKRGQPGCLKLWKSKGLEKDADAIVACVKRFRTSVQWAEQGGKFIPLPQSWLNDAPWLEEFVDARPPDDDDEGKFVRRFTPEMAEIAYPKMAVAG